MEGQTKKIQKSLSRLTIGLNLLATRNIARRTIASNLKYPSGLFDISLSKSPTGYADRSPSHSRS